MIAYKSIKPPIRGITSFPNPVEAATTLSCPYLEIKFFAINAIDYPIAFSSLSLVAVYILLMPGYFFTSSI